MMLLFSRYLLVALILGAALSFGVRFNDLLTRGDSDAASVNEVEVASVEPAAGAPETPLTPASEAVEAAAEPAPVDAAATTEEDTAAATEEGVPEIEPPKMDWQDATDSDIDFSPVQMELFQDLSQRRKDLEKREQELATREALLKATERNLEQKYKELNDLRGDVEGLLKEQNEQEKQRITSLVKIYEGMKAKDAARIFDTLDMDVLLQVMTQMSERKSAPILASMSADRARSVTIMLAEQKALPTLDENFAVQ